MSKQKRKNSKNSSIQEEVTRNVDSPQSSGNQNDSEFSVISQRTNQTQSHGVRKSQQNTPASQVNVNNQPRVSAPIHMNKEESEEYINLESSRNTKRKNKNKNESKKQIRVYHPSSDDLQQLEQQREQETIQEENNEDSLFTILVLNFISLIGKIIAFSKNGAVWALRVILTPIIIGMAVLSKYVFYFKNFKDPLNRKSIYMKKFKSYRSVKNIHHEKEFTLVLDLDETLVYTAVKKFKDYEKEIQVQYGSGSKKTFYLKLRPHVQEFLEGAAKYYNIVIFCDRSKEYADAVINAIPKNGLIKQRLYKEACMQTPTGRVKDLGIVTDDISKTVIIDNNEGAVRLDIERALLIEPFKGSSDDRELIKCDFVLKELTEAVKEGEDFSEKIADIKFTYFNQNNTVIETQNCFYFLLFIIALGIVYSCTRISGESKILDQ